MTDNNWYIARQGQQHGPISEKELTIFVKEGYLQPDDLIWRQGLPDWMRADQLESLLEKRPEATPEAGGPPPTGPEPGPFDMPTQPAPELRGQAADAADPLTAPPTGAAAAGGRSFAGMARWGVFGVSILVGAAAAYWFLASPESGDENKHQERMAAASKAQTAPEAQPAPAAEPPKEAAAPVQTAAVPQAEPPEQPRPETPPALQKAAEALTKAEVRRDGEVLVIEGGLLAGVETTAKAEFEAAPDIKVLRLESQGGDAETAYALRQLVFDRALVTYTVGGCAGACIIPFVAGKLRVLHTGAQLGFHQLPPPKSEAAGPAAKQNYLAGRGVLTGFVAKVDATPKESIWTPSLEELIEASVIDGLTEDEQFGVAPLTAEKTMAVFRSALERTAFARALAKHETSFHEAILDPKRMALALQRSLSPRLYTGFYARSMKQNMLSQARNAPDQAVSDLATLFVARLKMLTKRDSEKCYKYYFSEELGDVDYLKEFSRDEILEELDVWTAILVGTKVNPQQSPRPQDVQTTMQRVLEVLSKEQGASVKVLADRPAFLSAEMGLYCNVLINLYEIILRSPLEERGKLLRFIFAGGK